MRGVLSSMIATLVDRCEVDDTSVATLSKDYYCVFLFPLSVRAVLRGHFGISRSPDVECTQYHNGYVQLMTSVFQYWKEPALHLK
jgi:hypothetical protein